MPLAVGLAIASAAVAKATIGDDGAYLACQQYWPGHFTQNSQWFGNCNSNVQFVYSDDLVQDEGAAQTQYPLIPNVYFIILRADEPALTPEQQCAIDQNHGVAISGTTGTDFNTVEEARLYFTERLVDNIQFSPQGVEEPVTEPVQEETTWGKIKSLFK
jgi:hypothetical protein